MPLSGYNIVFQSRTDYFSMEGKWLGENPSTNPKCHDSGLKEPACFSFPPPPSLFSLPSGEKQSNNWKLTVAAHSPYLFHCFDTCSHCYLDALKGGKTNIWVDISYFLFADANNRMSQSAASARGLLQPPTCFMQTQAILIIIIYALTQTGPPRQCGGILSEGRSILLKQKGDTEILN